MIPFPDKKYNIIYADPAWSFTFWSDKAQRKVSDKYNLMSAEDIYKLPVNEIAEDNCILFIWVTYPNLLEGLETIKRWGFKYKTCGFSWIKKNKKADSLFWGLGYWTRANNEICLLATKGKPKRVSRDGSSVCGESAWWDVEPNVGRVAHGIPGRVHRLKGLGNSIIPQIAEEIGRAIIKAMK